jgi:hypothetical protein
MHKKNIKIHFIIIGFIILIIVSYFILNNNNKKTTTSSSSVNTTCYKNGPIMSCTKTTQKAQPTCKNSPNNDFPYNKDTKCCNGKAIEYSGTPTKYDLFCPGTIPSPIPSPVPSPVPSSDLNQ